jgi:hypothetical protein
MVQSLKNNVQEDCFLFKMNGVYKRIIHIFLNDLKNSQEPSKLLEDELPGDSIKITLKFSSNSIGRIQEYQKELYYESYEEFISCHDVPLPYSPISTMYLQDSAKGRVIQRRRRLHRSPLNLSEVDF